MQQLKSCSILDRSPVARIVSPSFDAAEEYLLRIEFGIHFEDPGNMETSIQHYINVINIAAPFESHCIVRDYLEKCHRLIDIHNAHQLLETAMVVDSEEFVLLSINFMLQDFNCFMRTVGGCSISRQKMFLDSLIRLLKK